MLRLRIARIALVWIVTGSMLGLVAAHAQAAPLRATDDASTSASGQKGNGKHGRGAKAEGRSEDRDVARPRADRDGPGAHGKAVPRGSRNDDTIAWRGRPNAWMDRDRSVVVVREYYDRRRLPPGLAKRQSLPPGLQKQLRERGHLPPGLERRWAVLPEPLERDLPPLPPHHVRRIVGNDLLVVDLRFNIVVSLWRGVF